MRDYLDSMRKMRTEPADKFIVAHYGIYDEILPLVDMEARFFAERMVDLLDLVDGPTTPAKMAADICRTYHIDAGDLRNLSYFATSSLSYINYLRGWAIWRPTLRITRFSTAGPPPLTSARSRKASRCCRRQDSSGENE